ncbi:metal ABC transporter permease [soil metagenome]
MGTVMNILTEIANTIDVPRFMIIGPIAGLMVGLLGGYYGAFVVQRGLSFLGNGLAHAAFGGVALGILLNAQPLAIAVPFTIVVALAIVWLQQHTKLGADTSIGILFSVSMALGVIFLQRAHGYHSDAFTYLFGSILAVQPSDLAIVGGTLLASLATIPIWGRWAYASFDRELARADRVPCLRDDYILAVAMAVTVVVAMKVVGIVLIAAFLVIPPATARLFAKTFRQMTILSILCAIVSVIVGMAASIQFDLPTGAVVILTQAAFFAAAMAARPLRSA